MKHARRHAAPVRWPVVLAVVAAGSLLLALVLVLLQTEREEEFAPAVLAVRPAPGAASRAAADASDPSAGPAVQPLGAEVAAATDGAAVAPAAEAVAADGTVAASFRGRVVTEGGAPIAGALVRHVPVSALREKLGLVADKRHGELHWDMLAVATTDADGRFTLPTRELPRKLPDPVPGAAPADGEAAADAGGGAAEPETLVFSGGMLHGLGYSGGNFRIVQDGDAWSFGSNGSSGEASPGTDDEKPPEPPVLLVVHPAFAVHVHEARQFRSGACDVGTIALKPGVSAIGRVTDLVGRVVADAHIGSPVGTWNSSDGGHWDLVRQILRADSGPDGRFRIDGLWAEGFEFEASHPDFVPRRFDVDASEGQLADAGDQKLMPGRAIRGRVLDADGTPRAGIEILARPAYRSPDNPGLDTLLHEASSDFSYDGGHEVRTRSAADGSFVLGTLDLDAYSVFADAPDREPACARDVRVGASDVRLVLSAAGAVLLTVVDGATGAPLPGAKATARRRSRSSERVTTQFDPELQVLAGPEALAAVRALTGTTAAGGATGGATAGSAASAADASATAGAAASTTAAVGVSADGALVGTAGATPDASAAETGAGLLLVTRAGAVRTDVIVSAPGHGTHGFVLQGVKAGELSERTLKLWSESVIAGRLLDPDGQPIAGAEIACKPPGTQRVALDRRTVTTRPDGSFRFAALTAGEWSLSAKKSGWLGDKDRPVFVKRAQVREGVDLSLHRGAVLTGVVLDARGAPATDTNVGVQQEIGGKRSSQSGSTDARGRFRIEGLLPGTGVVNCWPAESVTLTLSAAQPTDIVLQLRARPVVSGRVLRDGQPMGGASVTARSLKGNSTRTTADAAGAFELELWDAGDWSFSAMPGSRVRTATTLPVPLHLDWNARAQVELAFAGFTVVGRVVDAVTRTPVPGASVTLAERGTPSSGPVTAVTVPQWLRRPSATIVADAEGRFRFEWVAPGDCSMSARGQHRRTAQSVPLTVGPQMTGEIELELPQGQGLRGTLRTASGAALPPSLHLRLTRDGTDEMWWLSAGDEGAWEYWGELQPGGYHVHVEQDVENWFGDAPARELISAPVTLVAGETAVVDLSIDG